jgi:D-arabinose 1-dehydrogenase-like Zn-dependent alcohol dehydrogenase
LTAYSALAKANLKQGDYVVVPGAGGGLGHLYVPQLCTDCTGSSLIPLTRTTTHFADTASAVQIAKKKGYKVIAVDRFVSHLLKQSELMLMFLFSIAIQRNESSVFHSERRNSLTSRPMM